MPRTLLVATHNAHKTKEIRDILSDLFDEIIDLSRFSDRPAPEETGSNFAENSAIKALDASRHAPDALVLADDSGLEVDALNGDPGVHSARYAGEHASDADNRRKLLMALGQPEHADSPRTARFRCVITLAKNGKILARFDGSIEGTIATTETGDGGFGYDSLFIPEGYHQSFGELSAEQKNSMSHRARALEKLSAWLGQEMEALFL